MREGGTTGGERKELVAFVLVLVIVFVVSVLWIVVVD